MPSPRSALRCPSSPFPHRGGVALHADAGVLASDHMGKGDVTAPAARALKKVLREIFGMSARGPVSASWMRIPHFGGCRTARALLAAAICRHGMDLVKDCMDPRSHLLGFCGSNWQRFSVHLEKALEISGYATVTRERHFRIGWVSAEAKDRELPPSGEAPDGLAHASGIVVNNRRFPQCRSGGGTIRTCADIS